MPCNVIECLLCRTHMDWKTSATQPLSFQRYWSTDWSHSKKKHRSQCQVDRSRKNGPCDVTDTCKSTSLKKKLWFQSKIITVAKHVSKHTLPPMTQCVVCKPPYNKKKKRHRSQCNVGRTRRHGSFHVTATCKSTSLKKKVSGFQSKINTIWKIVSKCTMHAIVQCVGSKPPYNPRRMQSKIPKHRGNPRHSWFFVLIWDLGMCMGNANKTFKSHNKKKRAAPTAEKLQSRHCRAYRQIHKICKLYKSLISQMITVSTKKNQSDQTFCQAHAIRSTELKPKTPKICVTKTCTCKNKQNQNINTNLDLLMTFWNSQS